MSKKIQKIFVIMPFGNKGTEEENKMSYRYYAIIKPILEKYAYNVKRADEYDHLGNITRDIINDLFEADIVIADLSGKNPNVFYELGVRHALRKSPTIPIAIAGENIPFDISTYRTIFFDDSEQGHNRLIEELNQKIEMILTQGAEHIDNPVYDILQNKISDIKDENIKYKTSKNLYESECERLRNSIDQSLQKRLDLADKIRSKEKEAEKGNYLLSLFKQETGKDILYKASKFINVNGKYWTEVLLQSKCLNIALFESSTNLESTTAKRISGLVDLERDFIILTRYMAENMYEIAALLGIKIFPTVLFVKEGKEIVRLTGLQKEYVYQGVINKYM